MAALAFAPPSQGQMLLVPMTEAAAAALPRLATANESRIVGRGPVAGSLVIEGRRAALFMAALSSAMLVIAAPQVGCGTRDPRGQARIWSTRA